MQMLSPSRMTNATCGSGREGRTIARPILAALLSESPDVLPVHRKILAFAFIGWVFDFYDLMLLSFVIASTTLVLRAEIPSQEGR